MKEYFWSMVKAQISQSRVQNDNRVRFPGASTVVKTVALDLKRSNELSRDFGRALKKPINTVLVMYAEIPQEGYNSDRIVSLYTQQKRLRRIINEELMDFLIINSHLGWESEELVHTHDFWKFSDEAISAINQLAYFLIATNHDFDFTL